MTVLDLPIEKQKELAERRGMQHSEWCIYIKKSLKETEEFVAGIEVVEYNSKEEADEADELVPRWHDEQLIAVPAV